MEKVKFNVTRHDGQRTTLLLSPRLIDLWCMTARPDLIDADSRTINDAVSKVASRCTGNGTLTMQVEHEIMERTIDHVKL